VRRTSFGATSQVSDPYAFETRTVKGVLKS